MNLIVAVSRNYGIGKDGRLLFSIPEDMRYFRDMTMGSTVVMGRATLESLPGGRPLKGRRNIVLSRDPMFRAEGVSVVNTLSQLAELLEGDAFVIGGEAVYRLLLDYCQRAYVTAVEAEPPADRFFPNLDEAEGWELESRSEPKLYEGLEYRFKVYRNHAVKPACIYTPCGYMTEYRML